MFKIMTFKKTGFECKALKSLVNEMKTPVAFPISIHFIKLGI